MKVLVCLISLVASSVMASIRVEVQSNSGIEAIAYVEYVAKKDSFLCRESYWDEGGSRVSRSKRKKIIVKQYNKLLIINKKLDSFCQYELSNGLKVGFHIPGYAKAISSKHVIKLINPNKNHIQCDVIDYGPSNNTSPHLLCSEGSLDIELDLNGNGKVIVDLL
jgi:hypothetical protein